MINVINISSIQLVKVVDFFIYFFVIVIITIHFILTYIFFSKNTKIYSYFNYSYQLLEDIIYCKYFVSEGIYLYEVPDYPVIYNKEIYLYFLRERIGYYGDDIAKIIYQFNNPNVDLPKEYTDFIKNTNLTIKTNNEFTKTEEQPYSSALSKLTTAIFYLSSSDKSDVFNMENNFAYELMVNLMDSYYRTFEKVILIMVNFLDERTKDIKTNNLIIFFVSFVISVTYLILFYRMVVRLDRDREKPLNLYLTIKNKIFEDLKNSSENFSNKLLNKFFRVDENEEESQQNYYSQINIKPNDINIAKFKALNEYKSLNKKENSFMGYFIQLIVFYGIINIIIFLEYINTIFFCENIHNYIQIYNSTYFSEIYLITRMNIIKQYFYNTSITNYGFEESVTKYNFLYAFLFMSQEIEPTIKETSKTTSFLKDEYKDVLSKYFYGNITDLVKDELFNVYNTEIYLSLVGYLGYGFSSIGSRIFESLKYLAIRYFIDPEIYS